MAIDAVTRFELVCPGDRVLCALSGGADSVCLVHLMAQKAKSQGFTVAAAHFSHGLRPESADSERQLCQRLCDRLEIPLFCGRGDTRAWAAAHGSGEEEAARELRRAFLLETADRWQATSVATGHHLEDSAETLLFNLIRGTGGQGLQGIPPRNGRFIRPLILAEKSEILAYIREYGLEYADDPTNFTGDNARARMRREVFPGLQAINPKAAVHLARTALDNWQQSEALRLEAQQLAEGSELPIPQLLAASEEAAVRAMQTAQRACGGRMLERPHIGALFALCRSEHPSGEVHLPGSRAVRRYHRLVFVSGEERPVPEPLSLWPEQTASFGDWELTLTCREGEGLPIPVPQLPLTVRCRRPGDTVSMPYGTKTLKKLLIEQKIPKDLRDTVPILCDNKEIIAVGGLVAAHLPLEKTMCIICRRKEI